METSKFREIIGNSPTARVIEYLIESEGLDFSLSDLARGAEVGWTTLHRIWKSLETSKLVKFTRKIGNAKLFTLNLENPIAQELKKIYLNVTIESVAVIPVNDQKETNTELCLASNLS